MMSDELLRVVRACALAAIFAVSGCSSSAVAVSDRRNVDTNQSFEATLRKCRRLQPGRLNQRMNLPPTSLRVSRCLRKLGWQPDGSRYEPDLRNLRT
ncbi:hypothetical protein [Peristeroidobacter agariperforans]|uniref:hypothetical protein n=1 Tax=Peristeroidobacter agariperforans TaxID=268404 RepID=UPI00101C74A6|nr:hypothetical protein [Peristeroidobacter agariperforans]